jgi:hypothetical protein
MSELVFYVRKQEANNTAKFVFVVAAEIAK